MKNSRPLEGIKVIEAGIALAGPFAGSLLAELGAEVIKVEKPGGGDPMRLMGPRKDGLSLWWGVAARGKQCLDLDFKQEGDKKIFRQLVAEADILVENYRPGVMNRLGLGWEVLSQDNPRLIMLSISGFGQTGPDSGRPGFGKIAEALSGIVALTGKPDEIPLNVGFSLADTSTGLMGFLGVMLALYQRDLGGGKGAHIDVALYEPLFRIAECQLALCERLGRPAVREGTNDPYGWGCAGAAGRQTALQCADGRWIMIALDSLGGGDREALRQELAVSVSGWDSVTALDKLASRKIEAVLVQDGATLAEDAYFRQRGDVLTAVDPKIGSLVVPGEVGKFQDVPPLPLFKATEPDSDRSLLSRRGLERASAQRDLATASAE